MADCSTTYFLQRILGCRCLLCQWGNRIFPNSLILLTFLTNKICIVCQLSILCTLPTPRKVHSKSQTHFRYYSFLLYSPSPPVIIYCLLGQLKAQGYIDDTGRVVEKVGKRITYIVIYSDMTKGIYYVLCWRL